MPSCSQRIGGKVQAPGSPIIPNCSQGTGGKVQFGCSPIIPSSSQVRTGYSHKGYVPVRPKDSQVGSGGSQSGYVPVQLGGHKLLLQSSTGASLLGLLPQVGVGSTGESGAVQSTISFTISLFLGVSNFKISLA